MTSDVPSAARSLVKRLGPGWSHYVHPSTGTCDFGGLSEETDGEGKRKRVSNIEPVKSYLIRGWHPDGRAFVAVWMSRESKGGWTLDTCWRARHSDEFTPAQLTAGELGPYVAGENPEDALDSIQFYHEEQAARLAARKGEK